MTRITVEINFNDYKDEILDWVKDNFDPDHVFSYGDLQVWAEMNGFVEDLD